MASVVAQEVHGRVLVLGEIFLRHSTTQEAAAEFLKRFAEHRAEVVVYGDASGANQKTIGMSDYDVIKDYFKAHAAMKVRYEVPRSNPSVRERINLMNRQLRSAAGFVGLLVDGKCKELIRDFEEVSYKEDSGQIDKERDRLRTHLSDALGYLVLEMGRPKVGEQAHRLM
jgi:hypothetical protein